jgi:protein-tyrosine-phosphatase
LAAWGPDVVITIGDEALKQKCPTFVGTSVHVLWSIPDPANKFGNMENNFNETLRIIEKRIKKIFKEDMSVMDKTALREHLKKATQ